MPLLDVNCQEQSTYAESFHSIHGDFNDFCMPDSHNPTCSNIIVDSVADSVSMEKLVKMKKKKNNNNNKKKRKSSKEISDKIVSETGPSESGLDDALPSCQLAKEKTDSQTFNCDKCFGNDTSLASSSSQFASRMYGFSKDPSVYSHEDLNMSKQGPEEIVLTKNLQGGHLSQCNSYETTNVKPYKVKDCRQCSSALYIHPITTSSKNKCNILTSQWAARQRLNEICSPLSDGIIPCPLVSSSRRKVWVESSQWAAQQRLNERWSSLSDSLSPCPLVSSSRRKVWIESPRWAARQKLNESLFQFVSKSNQVGAYETEYFGKIKSNHSFKSESNCRSKKRLGCYGENCFRFHNQFVYSKRESLQVPYGTYQVKNSNKYAAHGSYYSSPASSPHVQQNVRCSANYSLPVQSGFQAYNGMKIPRRNHVLDRCFQASIGRQQYQGFELYNEYKFRKDATSGTNGKKWIPVGTKESRMLERTVSAGICNGAYDSLSSQCNGVNNSHPKGQTVPLCGPAALSDSNYTSFVSSHKLTSVEVQNADIAKDIVAFGRNPKDTPQSINGSDIAVQALTAAYKLQLASEGVELSMGCPLAEFERLIYCASPVIALSYIYKKCTVCLDSPLSHSLLCKHQIPNISLCAVWNWYEKPGNYGLEVKAKDSQNLKGLLPESTSFHAYFVPFLSAVQLFGYPPLSNCCGRSTEPVNCGMRDKQEVDFQASSSKTFFVAHSIEAVDVKVVEPVISSKVSTCNGSDSLSFRSSPICSNNSELIFEFFESEQPQQRKPLYNKIMELINDGTSNLQVFGDPSKLESLNLQDLHPASWFSVAWYPIYRIPEGNFRASFLTFHSLGHLVQKYVPTDSSDKKISSIVAPVLGLQSYNALGECWFDLRIPVESSLKESSPFNSSEILNEQLRTLEENALLFARGCVWKNNVKVFNQQPDYEFFISRKH